jgi:hypothetical protein
LVFISHNKADKEIAREIGLFLTAEGINVWFDEWVISAGDSITEQINGGLTNCTDFIILWSQNSSKSDWVRRELSSTISASISGNGTPKVIPVVLDPTPLPALLLDILFIKYNGGTEEDRSNIVRAITGELPSHSYIKAIVRKYKEVIYDYDDRHDPLPFKACPECGSTRFKKYMQTDYKCMYPYQIRRTRGHDLARIPVFLQESNVIDDYTTDIGT